jgi:phosphonate transport system substrate-binding protein
MPLVATIILLGQSPGLAQPAQPDPSPAAERRSLVIGRASNDPQRQIPRIRALANFLAAALADRGVTGGEVVLTRTNGEMARLLRDQRVDIALETVSGALQYRERAGARIVLREWRNGQPNYRSILFVRNDSPVRSLDDLRGRVVAFENPGSTSAFAAPAQILREHGLELAQIAPGGQVRGAATGYAFAGSELNVTTWVHRSMVDAGVLSDADWRNPRRVPERIRADLRIIHESEPLLRAVVVVRSGLDPELTRAVTDALAGLHDSDDGRAVLRGLDGVTRYDRITPEVQIELDRTAALLGAAVAQGD